MRHKNRVIIVGSLLLLVLGAELGYLLLYSEAGSSVSEESLSPELEKEKSRILKELKALNPRGYYVLVDTAANRLYLRKGDETVVDAVCSTGSGRTLVAGDRSWTFQTPRGVFRIQNKTTNPIWRKPDWAFLEEGEPLPKRAEDRYESGVLGEYALGIGDGYFIHGTLYTRMLGQNVTHGCIRLGPKELTQVARNVPIGAKVFIF